LAGLLGASSARAAGGILVALEYGRGTWSIDRQTLADQLPKAGTDPDGDLAGLFLDNLHSGQAATLRLGYNILGYSTVEAHLTATGWNVTEVTRGGAAFVGGSASFHPLKLFLPAGKADCELFLGYGWGIVGQKKGMAGNAFLWGLRGQYHVGRVFFVGGSLRMHHLQFDEYYRDFDNRTLPGQTLPLASGSGGTFMALALQIGFLVDPTE
jgi:hypothetical protein